MQSQRMLRRKHTGLEPRGVFTDGSVVQILCLHSRGNTGQGTKIPHDMQRGQKKKFFLIKKKSPEKILSSSKPKSFV